MDGMKKLSLLSISTRSCVTQRNMGIVTCVYKPRWYRLIYYLGISREPAPMLNTYILWCGVSALLIALPAGIRITINKYFYVELTKFA